MTENMCLKNLTPSVTVKKAERAMKNVEKRQTETEKSVKKESKWTSEMSCGAIENLMTA